MKAKQANKHAQVNHGTTGWKYITMYGKEPPTLKKNNIDNHANDHANQST